MEDLFKNGFSNLLEMGSKTFVMRLLDDTWTAIMHNYLKPAVFSKNGGWKKIR
jgi:hypothetical protein